MRFNILKVSKHDKEERFKLAWENSVCEEDHHYVILGKLDSDEIAMNIYTKPTGSKYLLSLSNDSVVT